jgi:hypothetical protein
MCVMVSACIKRVASVGLQYLYVIVKIPPDEWYSVLEEGTVSLAIFVQ